MTVIPNQQQEERFIGRGEKVAVKILNSTFPEATISTQVSIKSLVSEEIFEMYSDIYKKATIDILMAHHRNLYAIRVQDTASHTGTIASLKDAVQRKDMQNNGIIVIDIFEREASYLFRNIDDYRSMVEVLLPLKMAGVKP